MSAPGPGDRISNYVLEARLGEGSFGQVWKARHHIFNDAVAIKIPTDPQYVRNLQREGVVVHGLRHVNIVRVLDLDPYADPPYLIMEYVPGPTLRSVIDRHPQGMPIAAAEAVFRGLLAALQAAHAGGLVHRDIKPANILLARDPADLAKLCAGDVRVTDFGLGALAGPGPGTILQSGSLARTEGLSGTIAYMSPEQRDGLAVDCRSDLYSAGIILFEMITGQRPQGGDLPSHLRGGLAPQWDEIFGRCYTRLERRYASAAEILRDLHAGGLAAEHLRDMQDAGASAPAAAAAAAPRSAHGEGERTGRWQRAAEDAGAEWPAACPRCGCGVEEQDQFCTHCGLQQVEHVPRCPHCAAYTYPADNFCILCGTSLAATMAGPHA